MPKGPRAYTTQPPSTDEKASGAKNKSSIGIKDTTSKMLSDEEWGSIEFSAMNEKGKALVMILWTNFTAALFIGPKSDRCLTLLQIQSLTHSGMLLLRMPTQKFSLGNQLPVRTVIHKRIEIKVMIFANISETAW